jgi:hypothetical protein
MSALVMTHYRMFGALGRQCLSNAMAFCLMFHLTCFAPKQYRSELESMAPTEEISHEEGMYGKVLRTNWIWANAIRTDQDNIEEEGWQIQLEQKVYERG